MPLALHFAMRRASWETQVFSATQMLGIQKYAAKNLVNALDQNRDGSIQYLEFCAACLLASTDELYAVLSQARGGLGSKDSKLYAP